MKQRRTTKAIDALTLLKRHLASCGTCQAGMKASDLSYMCDKGSWHVINAARVYDEVVKLRIAAHRQGGDVVFACPDLSAHGTAYAVTATAYHVAGIQDSLF